MQASIYTWQPAAESGFENNTPLEAISLTSTLGRTDNSH